MDHRSEVDLQRFACFCRAFEEGARSFVLEEVYDGDPERDWMDWSTRQGWVEWQVRSTCDHQCRLGTLTELGQAVLKQRNTLVRADHHDT
ncbi:MAG: hypothetical protein HQL83_03730 [Magnetococcales bacterium]|nr:hypothetical protein [Magnetococcales bacterium]MBF0347067.1 hypothetical protein [Magnetococcales bacterium]